MLIVEALMFYAVGATLIWISFVGPYQTHHYAILCLGICAICCGFVSLICAVLAKLDELKEEIGKPHRG